MTIIKPKKHSQYLKFFIITFLILFLGAVFYIDGYNHSVNLRYQLENLKKSIVQVQEKNADLKNELFKIIDPNRLNALAQEKGLTLERHPQYFSFNQ